MKLQIEQAEQTNIVKTYQNLALASNVITSSFFIEIFNKSWFFILENPNILYQF